MLYSTASFATVLVYNSSKGASWNVIHYRPMVRDILLPDEKLWIVLLTTILVTLRQHLQIHMLFLLFPSLHRLKRIFHLSVIRLCNVTIESHYIDLVYSNYQILYLFTTNSSRGSFVAAALVEESCWEFVSVAQMEGFYFVYLAQEGGAGQVEGIWPALQILYFLRLLYYSTQCITGNEFVFVKDWYWLPPPYTACWVINFTNINGLNLNIIN